MYEEELMKFWKSFASASRSRNFLKDSSTLRDKSFFPQFGSHLCTYWSDLHENFITNVTLDKEVHSKFRNSSGSEVRIRIRTSDPEQILVDGGMRSLTALVLLRIPTLISLCWSLQSWSVSSTITCQLCAGKHAQTAVAFSDMPSMFGCQSSLYVCLSVQNNGKTRAFGDRRPPLRPNYRKMSRCCAVFRCVHFTCSLYSG